jgi:adenosylcobyric acid synthase
MNKTKSIMVLGTASSVGKSLVAAGLCRVLSDWGYRVAPFKAQNMSNNSFVTKGGGEIGRAQAVQAECARLEPTVDMNPILLKPSADNHSQVIIHGKAIGHFRAREYFAQRELLSRAIQESYERLSQEYEVIVIEGAGSPAEINMKDRDLVNMWTAQLADAACVLVGDIDRGGIFAQLVGTLDLLEEDEQARIVGLIVNKFRGDITLFDDGIEMLEKKTSKKVWGVLPYDRELWIEEEDSVSVTNSPTVQDSRRGNDEEKPLDIAVIQLPRISNFTDFEVLRHETNVQLRYIKRLSDFGSPDLLILPGTKATIADLQYLTESGMRDKILSFGNQGGAILGICGGYQMMGKWIVDAANIESSETKVEGLGFFENMTTEFHPEKVLRQVEDSLSLSLFNQTVSGTIKGYEIHMGQTSHQQSYASFGKDGAIHPNGRHAGSYYHGVFDQAEFRQAFLKALADFVNKKAPSSASLSVQEIKERQYFRLRMLLENHLDLNLLKECLINKVPSTELRVPS